MNMLWNIDAIQATTGGQAFGPYEQTITHVAIDSRNVIEGSLFIALIGENQDGHLFLNDAFKAGAKAAIVQYLPESFPEDITLILVDDSTEALRQLADTRRVATDTTMIGLTGSVGKTTTKEMLLTCLTPYGKSYATRGNYNNHYGVPLTLANMPLDTDYAIIEMGMSAPNEIAPLSAMVQPHLAIVTNVEKMHLEFFDSVDEIAKAKAEIFQGLIPGGAVILNRDNHAFSYLHQEALNYTNDDRVFSVGELPGADAVLTSYEVSEGKAAVTAVLAGNSVGFTLPILGKHHAINSLLVLQAIHVLGLSPEKAIAALKEFSPISGRGGIAHITYHGKDITLLDESYNAGPASTTAAIATLHAYRTNAHKRSVAILGDMFELGEEAPTLHSELSKILLENNIDMLCTIGTLMQHLHASAKTQIEAHHFVSTDAFMAQMKELLHDKDIILVKGSNGMKMNQIIAQLKG